MTSCTGKFKSFQQRLFCSILILGDAPPEKARRISPLKFLGGKLPSIFTGQSELTNDSAGFT